MASLLLGPMHRYADAHRVSVWVETDAPCVVEVRAMSEHGAEDPSGEDGPRGTAHTFTVGGHHYALVGVGGLDPARSYPYEVWLTAAPLGDPVPGDPAPADRGAVRVWPETGRPPSLLRPIGGGEQVTLVFGSCRRTAPQTPPYVLPPELDERGLGVDALYALARRMTRTDPSAWPDALLLLGDQVYADHVPDGTARRIRERRGVTVPPGDEIADFDEYTWLYQEAWTEPEIRWLLSTVPTAMIGDDHDVRDDWNISADWRAAIRAKPWWDARITGGLMAYWLYQHIGNLDPDALAADPVYAVVTAPARLGQDAEDLLRAFARRADGMADLAALAAGESERPSGPSGPGGVAEVAGHRPPTPPRWSYRWDLGRTRLIVIDSRLSRVVAPDGTRTMVNDSEWSWIRAQTRHTGEVDHLLLATSVPYLLTPLIHHVEAVSEVVASGRFGRWSARAAERVRQMLDLEHWAAFDASFRGMTELLRAVASGEHGPAPASVVVLSGDVHHAYLARATLAGAPTATSSPVWQAVCSPLRNPLGPGLRRLDAASRRRLMAGVARPIARAVGRSGHEISWTVTDGPWFDGQFAALELDGRNATLRLEKTVSDGGVDGLHEVLRVVLSPVSGESRVG